MKGVLITAALLGSSLALAQTNQPAPLNGPGPHGGSQGQWEQPFEEVKAKHLEHIGKRIAELQRVQSCVQAASNPEALHACRPQHRHN
jgi:hypothetical protein